MFVCRSYFSIDNYADDPASEVGGIKAAYAPVIPKLRKPNPLEPKGQGLVRLSNVCHVANAVLHGCNIEEIVCPASMLVE